MDFEQRAKLLFDLAFLAGLGMGLLFLIFYVESTSPDTEALDTIEQEVRLIRLELERVNQNLECQEELPVCEPTEPLSWECVE
jgi:hypothetical protein